MRELLTEKFKNPSYILPNGYQVWLDRYGNIIAKTNKNKRTYRLPEIPNPISGMVFWNTDTHELQIFNGNEWLRI